MEPQALMQRMPEALQTFKVRFFYSILRTCTRRRLLFPTCHRGYKHGEREARRRGFPL